jgi:predicted transposase YdaD
MLGLSDLKQTRVYQEAQEEVLEKTVPLLLQAGMSVEQIATQLNFPVETIQRFVPQTK